MTPEKVEEILRYGRDTLSLQAPVGDDEAVLGDFITDVDSIDPQAAVETQMLHGPAVEVLDSLPSGPRSSCGCASDSRTAAAHPRRGRAATWA
jgi:DNA-directed RNA polymerase sigma subunit (sigma70/sigma32)